MSSQERSARSRLLVACLATGAAGVLRAIIPGLAAGQVPYGTMVIAVVISAWYGGLWPAMVSTILGAALAQYFFIGSAHFPIGESSLDLTRLAFFLAIGTLVGLFAQKMYVIRTRLAERNAMLLQEAEQRQLAEQRERAHREHLNMTLQGIGDGVIVTDSAGIITLLNPVAERLTGWPSHKALGRPVEEVFILRDPQARDQIGNPALQSLHLGRVTGQPSESLLVRRDGGLSPTEASASPIRDHDGTLVGSALVFRDVTERRRAEMALRDSESELSDLFENANVGLHWTSGEGIIIRANREELEMLGYSEAEYIGHPIREFHLDTDIIASILDRQQRGERIDDQPARLRARDGSIRHVLISSTGRRTDGRLIHSRCFTVDVTARVEMESALREGDRRKDEFLATLAHELRNPLAPVRYALDRLAQELQPGDVERLRGVLARQVGYVTRLVDDLIDLSRISSGKLEMRRSIESLESIVSDALESARPDCENKRISIEVSLPPEPVYLDGDRVRLTQALVNLLGNACKFSDEGSTIHLSARADEAEVSLVVEDEGIGIPAERVGLIFDLFAQGHERPEDSRGGLGIGLTIVRRLVEMHQGTIAVSNPEFGKGTRFTVRLPRASYMAPVLAPPVLPLPVIEARWLVADDNADSADTLAMLLKVHGSQVNVAYDGEAAVQLFAQSFPEIVLLDIGMPVRNGYDACREIRSMPGGTDTVIIALTGWGQAEDRRKSREAGFDGHLVKPVDYQELLRLVDALRSKNGRAPTVGMT